MSPWRISAGALVEREGRLLLVRHVKPGAYDFWVAPGGGVQGDESLEDAARREVWEETGLHVTVGPLRYIEDLVDATCRVVKFWFSATLDEAGTASGHPQAHERFDLSHPEAQAEHIAQAAWLDRAGLAAGPAGGAQAVFPVLLLDRYWADRKAGFGPVQRLPLRRMEIG